MSFTQFRVPIVPQLKRNTILSLLERGVRVDERTPDAIRPIEIIPNYVEKAEGSALVKLGRTVVIAGVKMEIGEPFRDMPNSGVITVHAEFVPLASPSFEPGPPDENAIELARVVDRGLRELGAVDLEQLVLIPGRKVWIVWIDLYVIDHDGNLLDAAALATMAALMNTRIPKAEIEEDHVTVDKSVKTDPLPLKHKVVSVHIAKIGEHLIVDPSLDEEVVSDARIAFIISEEGLIAGAQKMGQGGLTHEELIKAANLALSTAPKYFNAINKVTGGLQ
ncbi:MAG: exosome complex protein Rrp42 [Desulfurococcales archaeon]|nr:exosome complex protein Rrp42 [Desulfurococcales archaeon]